MRKWAYYIAIIIQVFSQWQGNAQDSIIITSSKEYPDLLIEHKDIFRNSIFGGLKGETRMITTNWPVTVLLGKVPPFRSNVLAISGDTLKIKLHKDHEFGEVESSDSIYNLLPTFSGNLRLTLAYPRDFDVVKASKADFI